MTSAPPAEPRPPPHLRRPPDSNRTSLGRNVTHASSPIERRPSGLQRQLSGFGDDRPAKRRKIDADGELFPSQIPSYIPVPLVGKGTENNGGSLRLVKPSTLRERAGKLSDKEEAENSSEEDVPDLPPRPWRTTRLSKPTDETKPTHRSRVNVPVPNTPDSIEFPSSAPHFVPKKPAGFFPWTGKHPEDALTDNNVKNGFFDKPPTPAEKELNTARVPLYNAFKHKSGVDSLSLLFTLVLDQKNQHGLISSVSTFRPPPRVTLTEAKRKSWIADLANADVPLRRLSRTIPQGIRGQTLLDQCLQNSVPIGRAIWFAKCVCANEIRTLKRKGTTPAVAVGTESKWLREWTVNVEQFLETHLGQSNQPDWKTNIQYALRLTTRLYLENLLDRDHYLDWILRSFTTADVGPTTFWLMVMHIYKQDLSYYRRRSTQFAQALIGKYLSLNKHPAQKIAPLKQKLRGAIRELLFARPAIFLMPDTWPETLEVLRVCLDKTIPLELQLWDELNRVNERVMGFNQTDFSSTRAPEQVVTDILDQAQVPYNISLLDEALRRTCSDFPLLIRLCLEWSCTHFRFSRTRVYLAARLIKRWQRDGQDIDAAVLNFISAYLDGTTTADIQCLRHLIAQLSRSDCFPTSKYMQWLMVRGLPKSGSLRTNAETQLGLGRGTQSNEPSESCHFLLDLSLHKAPDHAINLRSSMLVRAGADPNFEGSVFQQCVHFIEQRLANSSSATKSEAPSVAEPSFSSLPWSLRSRISMWLRSRALEGARVAPSTPALPGSKKLNEDQFVVIRHILESMEDIAVLADVVGILLVSHDDDLMASLVATVYFHADVFSAIGALEILQKQMCQVYMNWRPSRPTMPLLTSALLDLCVTFPTRMPAVKLLQQDLVRGDRGRAVAACSPYSDGIAESLQQAGATFVEDFEAILQSETNMNEQTMNGLFSVLVDRIEKQQKFEDDPRTTLSFCQLLSRLRLCRRAQGDLLIQRWMSRLLPRLDAKLGPLLLRTLIATGCLTFPGLFEANTLAKPANRKNVAVATLLYQILTNAENGLLDWPAYQTRTRWYEYTRREPMSALEMLCEAGLQGFSAHFDALLLSLLVADYKSSSSSLSPPARKWFVKALSRMLSCNESVLKGADLNALWQSVNIFSLRYVQVRFLVTPQNTAEEGSGVDQEELAEVLSESLKHTPPAPNSTNWQTLRFPQLLQLVGPAVANQIRHKVENDFLDALPRLSLGKATSPLTAVFPSDTQQLSLIVERAFQVCRKDTTPSPGFTLHLIDRLSQHLKYLGTIALTPVTPVTSAPPPPGHGAPSSGMNPPQATPVTTSPAASTLDSGIGASSQASLVYLKYLLQMVCLQRPALLAAGRSGSNAKQAQSEQVQLLVRLASIAIHPAMTSSSGNQGGRDEPANAKEMVNFIFGVVATIVDEVSDDVRMICAKLLKDKLQNLRLRYLFGSINMMGSVQVQDLGQGLQMVKEGKGMVGEWKPRMWEVLDNGSSKENETSLGLGLFGARYG